MLDGWNVLDAEATTKFLQMNSSRPLNGEDLDLDLHPQVKQWKIEISLHNAPLTEQKFIGSLIEGGPRSKGSNILWSQSGTPKWS
jgi:hypothetical protein